ncbi:MAG: hypothetical protein KAI53_03605 [Candidatus Aenigmarchaeota archaeon]|nr:hypothetical protein [Candidatus Aenigmarchaeota archaeon]
MEKKNLQNLKDGMKDAGIDFENFLTIISKHKRLISRGNLGELYCHWLFGVVLNEKVNEKGYDGRLNLNGENHKVEIKCRQTKLGNALSLELNPKTFDILFYVVLKNDNSLLPKKIEFYRSEELKRWIKNKQGTVNEKNGKPRICFGKDLTIKKETVFE